MHSNQRKSCDVMIEQDFLSPASLIMAIVTFSALFTFVYVILFVAANAGYFQFVFIHIAFMA
jgi:hypothetical protein